MQSLSLTACAEDCRNAAMPPQTLMIDADDTLWENNIFFERAIDRFVELVSHPELSAAEVRDTFNSMEAVRVKTHGYGTDAFHQSLLAGFVHLTGAPCTSQQAADMAACAASVREAEIELLRGVPEALPRLAKQHTLILVTKGQHEEQVAKLQRSGLAQHFHHVEVLREKHTEAYLELLERYGCDPARTWMIGNSPRSDMNPALRAGLQVVYMPHSSTWLLEQEDLATPSEGHRLLRISTFDELLQHFG